MSQENKIDNSFEQLNFKEISFLWFFVLSFFLSLLVGFSVFATSSSFIGYFFIFLFFLLSIIFIAHSSYLMARQKRSLWSFVGYGFLFSFLLSLAGFSILLVAITIFKKDASGTENVALPWLMAFYYIGAIIFVLSTIFFELLGGVLWKMFLFEKDLKELNEKEQRRLSTCVNVKTISAFILGLLILGLLILIFFKFSSPHGRSSERVLRSSVDDLIMFFPIISTLSLFPVFYLVHRKRYPFLKFAGKSFVFIIIFAVILYGFGFVLLRLFSS
jgi:hypothetical protein